MKKLTFEEKITVIKSYTDTDLIEASENKKNNCCFYKRRKKNKRDKEVIRSIQTEGLADY